LLVAAWVALLGLSPPVASQVPVGVERPPATQYFSAEHIARAKAYATGRQRLFLAGVALKLCLLAIFALTPAGPSIRRYWAGHLSGRPWLADACFVATLLLIFAVVTGAFDFYRNHLRERAFGLSHQAHLSWLGDFAKGLGVTAAIAVPLVLGLLRLMRAMPAWWFAPASLVAGSLLVSAVALVPILIDPLFHRFAPVADPGVRARALALAERAGIPVREVLQVDASRKTGRLNAYFTGLGGTTRIVLFDTLLAKATPEEVDLVLAHEMGHWRHRHIWKGIAIGALGIALLFLLLSFLLRSAIIASAFGLSGPGDAGAVPFLWLVFFVLNLATLPIQTGISRAFEREADRESLRLTGNPDGFIRTEVRLAEANLADPDPPRWVVVWLYTHPPVLDRIGMAEAYRARQGR
jgi:STE24 endopeptidase